MMNQLNHCGSSNVRANSQIPIETSMTQHQKQQQQYTSYQPVPQQQHIHAGIPPPPPRSPPLLPSVPINQSYVVTSTVAAPQLYQQQNHVHQEYFHPQQQPLPQFPTSFSYDSYTPQQYQYYQQMQQHPPSYPANANSYSPNVPPPPPPPPPPYKNKKKKKDQQSKNYQPVTSEYNSTPYECQQCSVSFLTLKAYETHTSTHITCSYSNCTFQGSSKVVSAHYSTKHGKYSGRGLKSVMIQVPGSKKLQRFKICVGNHPDDIKAWIEERKKKFPTRKRLEKIEEKKKRKRDEGVLLSGENARGCNSQKKKQKSFHCDSPIAIQKDQEDQAVNKNDILQKLAPSDNGMKLKNSDNALTTLACYGSSSDDDDDEHDNDEEKVNTELIKNKIILNENDVCVPCNPNNSMNMDSDTSNYCTKTVIMHNNYHQEQRADQDDTENNKSKQNPSSKFKTKQCRYFIRNGTCKNGDNCTYIHDIQEHEMYHSNSEKKRQIQSKRDKAKNKVELENNLCTSGRDSSYTSGRRGIGGNNYSQTLLRKLLQNDIKRERSLCLQLIRYIVDCNFLQEKRNAV